MKSCIILILLLLTVLPAGSCFSFDGERKGFVIGGGVGIGPKIRSSNASGWNQIDESGLATNLLIGHAWNEKNIIALLQQGVYFTHSYYTGSMFGPDEWKERNVSQGFIGMALFHYYGPAGHSPYFVFGTGLQYRIPLESDYDLHESGPGLLIGGGYEFMHHVQFYGSISGGTTTTELERYYHYQILFTFSAVAF